MPEGHLTHVLETVLATTDDQKPGIHPMQTSFDDAMVVVDHVPAEQLPQAETDVAPMPFDHVPATQF